MALLGSDFLSAVPADTDQASLAATQIRDVKSRLKGWASVCFNLDTGAPSANIFNDSALSLTGVSANTYNNVTVTTSGRVTAGSNATYPSSVTSPNASITA